MAGKISKTIKSDGDVIGPNGATNSVVALFDGVTGRLIKNSSITEAWLTTLTDNSIANALHRHSELVASDGSPDPALIVDATGRVGIGVAPVEKLHLHESSTRNVFQLGNYASIGSIYSSSDYMIGNNAKPAPTGTNAMHIMATHASLGARAIRMGRNLNGIEFHTLAGSVTAGNVFNSPRVMIRNNGRVGIGTISPATSALLDLTSTTMALLLSRMTTTQKGALTAVNGMLIYDSTLNQFQKYENGSWQGLGGGIWTDESASDYYRPNNVTDAGNTGFRVHDAGYTLLGQVAPTTGNNFGGGTCIDGTVLRINDGNVGTPTTNGTVPLWVKRYTNKSGTDWGCGTAYFGAVKTGGTNPLHTVVIDTYCQGGSIPASGGVLGSLLLHLKNDTCTAANQDIHNIQMITYTPSSNYQGQHCCFTNDVCNRYADKGWLTRYAAGWTNAFNASNESTSNYDNSCAYSTGSGSGGGSWYIGYECNSIAYDASVNKGEGIYFQTSTFDTHADCLRAEGNLDMRSGYDIAAYYTNSFIVRTGRQNSYVDKMWITSAGNMTLTGTLTMYNACAINMKDSGGTARGGLVIDGNNDWWTMSNGRYACIGSNCSQANPVLIRINSTNNCQLIRSPDTDSNGKHYVTLV